MHKIDLELTQFLPLKLSSTNFLLTPFPKSRGIRSLVHSLSKEQPPFQFDTDLTTVNSKLITMVLYGPWICKAFMSTLNLATLYSVLKSSYKTCVLLLTSGQSLMKDYNESSAIYRLMSAS